MFPSFLRMRGTTHEHKIFYESIVHVFLVPKPDKGAYVGITVDPPLRQGTTRHSTVVFQIPQEQVTEMELNLDCGDARERLQGFLKVRYWGRVADDPA